MFQEKMLASNISVIVDTVVISYDNYLVKQLNIVVSSLMSVFTVDNTLITQSGAKVKVANSSKNIIATIHVKPKRRKLFFFTIFSKKSLN